MHDSKSGVRIEYLDSTRGLLFLLMTSSHSIMLSRIPPTSFLYSDYWLPRGWATFGFIMLSGYTIACVFNWDANGRIVHRKVLHRAWMLFAVMVISNAAMMFLHQTSRHDLSPILNSNWWIGLLTGKTPYSISAILLPTALFLLASPLAHKMIRSLGIITVLALALIGGNVSIMLANSLSADSNHNHLIHIFITPGLGNFNILNLWFCGWIGYSIGEISKSIATRINRVIVSICIIMTIFLHFYDSAGGIHYLKDFAFRPCCFVFIIALSKIIGHSIPTRPISSFLACIGKYALFSFVMHRILLQSLHLVLTRVMPDLSSVPSYWIMLIGATGIMFFFCRIRDEKPSIDRILKSVYL